MIFLLSCQTLQSDLFVLFLIEFSHRYQRKIDCSTHISLWNSHFNKRMLVVSTKQSRQAWNRLGSPDCHVGQHTSPYALLACLLCFVPATSACLSECIFTAATNITNQTNKVGSICHSAVYFLSMMSMGFYQKMNRISKLFYYVSTTVINKLVY